MRRLLLLLVPDSAEGTVPPDPVPPAAEAVAEGGLREEDASETVRLARQLEETLKTVKDREVRISELEDENRQLKDIRKPVRKTADDWFSKL